MSRCCCHGLGEACDFEWAEEHVHHCVPRALDLGGHCPDAGCPGNCWERTWDQDSLLQEDESDESDIR